MNIEQSLNEDDKKLLRKFFIITLKKLNTILKKLSFYLIYTCEDLK